MNETRGARKEGTHARYDGSHCEVGALSDSVFVFVDKIL
jgi:hypothetical protein